MNSDTAKLQQRIRKFVDDRDWDQFHNPKDLSISLVLEATEVLEHFQWKSPEEMREHIEKHKDDVGEELADVLYWVLLLANKIDINLDDAFEKKMKKKKRNIRLKKPKAIIRNTQRTTNPLFEH